MKKISYILMITVCLVYGCKKAFNPALVVTDTSALVVEGYINTGSDSTIIRLSRTVAVSNKTALSVETRATVTVENATGVSYPLPETAVKGTYVSVGLDLDNTKQYRLRIKTSNGKTYLSDLVTPKITPPIDSIGYDVNADGIKIYANTHDPKNNSIYYRYTFSETWQFHAAYESTFIFSYQDTSLRTRVPAEQIYRCFGRDSSARTILYSTAALSNDIAFKVPIVSIADTSEKISTKYSILLRQQAMTKEAYEFYESLKKNTEDLGSIFDAQPSQLIGNLHSLSNPDEPVIGYISAGTTSTKRIYILKANLSQSFQVPLSDGCVVRDAYFYPSHNILKPPPPEPRGENFPPFYVEDLLYPTINTKLYTGPAYGLALEFFGKFYTGYYTYVPRPCADCTIRGVTKQPAFWK